MQDNLSYQHVTDILQDHLANLETFIVIATDAFVYEEKAGVGIVPSFLDWALWKRLPDFTPIYQA